MLFSCGDKSKKEVKSLKIWAEKKNKVYQFAYFADKHSGDVETDCILAMLWIKFQKVVQRSLFFFFLITVTDWILYFLLLSKYNSWS